MARDRIALRATDEREKLLDQAKGAIETDSDAEVTDAALRHLIQSVDNYETVRRQVDAELAEQPSTEIVRLTLYPQVRTDQSSLMRYLRTDMTQRAC